MTTDLGRTLADLVAIDSVSSRSNAEIARYLRAAAERIGFSTADHGYADEQGVEKLNVVASAGPSGDPPGAGGLALVGHTDTVPYDPLWTEALSLTERDGRLYGRGACDTKAFLAASLKAAAEANLRALRRPLCLVFTADEELGCVGARHLVSKRALAPTWAVVGEPTSLGPVRAHKGYCLGEIEVEGREAHSAYPELGTSAIFRAAHLIEGLERLGVALRAERDPAFDPPYTSLNVGTIHGGKAKNVLAGACRFPVEWRPTPGRSPDEVRLRIEDLVERVRAKTGGLPIRFVVTREDAGVATPPDAPIVRYFEAESGRPATTIPFGTELPQLTAMGAQGVVFGPGDIREAHRTGEFVPVDELHRAAAILGRAIERFCT